MLGRSALLNPAPDRGVFLGILVLVYVIDQMRDGLNYRETLSAGLAVDYHFLAVLSVFNVPNGQVD